MYTQSGELVIIFRDKKEKKKIGFFLSRLKSLRVCIILLFMCAGTIPTVVAYTGIVRAYETRMVALRTAEIQNQCTILSNHLISYNYLEERSSEVINAELTQLTNIYKGRVLIVDSELEVLTDTYALDEGKMMVSASVVRGLGGESTSYYDDENHYIEVASPITEPESGKVFGILLVSVSTDTVEDSLRIFNKNGREIVGIISVILLAVSVFLAELIVRPLRKIARGMEGITEGYATDVLHVDTFTETKRISAAFNKVMKRLKLLDDSREEFVSNVSHELKTPLASVKVLADSLLLQDNVPIELYQEFMQDIGKEIDRENDIINDLLTLVRMDKTAQTMNITQVKVNELLELILKRIKPLAEKKNVELVLESFRPVTAELDEVKISLAISNLVENGIKYNHDGGWVRVSLNADHKYFYIKVMDSGMGIPKEDQNHIFERFYRVDKSHSREIGGTGLGLAITRNVIIMHKGSVKVYSTPGEGTTFTVRIPLIHAM